MVLWLAEVVSSRMRVPGRRFDEHARAVNAREARHAGLHHHDIRPDAGVGRSRRRWELGELMVHPAWQA